MNSSTNCELKNKVIANFNKAGATYDASCTVQHAICDLALQLLPASARQFDVICDLACGTGESTFRLINAVEYKTCYALDAAAKLLSIAQSKLPHTIHYLHADYDQIPCKKLHLDLVFCNMGLQWSPCLGNTLSMIYDHLKASAKLLFTLPLQNNFPELNSSSKYSMPSDDAIKYLLKENGFRLIESLQKTYRLHYASPLAALQSIKEVGANLSVNHHKPHPLRGLSKKHFEKIFKKPKTTTLTYHLGIYLADV